MARRRERFERSDVPHNSSRRTLKALIVLFVVALGVGVIVYVCWTFAERDSKLGDSSLSDSLASQVVSTTTADGYSASTDVFTNVLLLTVNDINSNDPTLISAQLLSLDATTGKGVLIDIPLDSEVTSSTGATTLYSLFSGSGAAACIGPFATASNIQVSHVVVATSEIWDKVAELKGSGVQSIVNSASDLFDSIKTDMDIGELMDLAELVQSIGVSQFSRISAPTNSDTLDDGTQVEVLDQTQLGISAGTLVVSS